MDKLTNTPCSRITRFAPTLGLGILLATGAMVFSGCASTPAPTEEVAVSKAALAHAVGFGGADGAPVETRMAREKLDAANAAMADKDYDRARRLALEARADAQLAEARSRATIARKAADALQEDTRILQQEINRSSK